MLNEIDSLCNKTVVCLFAVKYAVDMGQGQYWFS